MDARPPSDQAYVTKRLTKDQRFLRAIIPALGALLLAVYASVVFAKGHEYKFWVLPGALSVVLVWLAWSRWMACELTELATVRIQPTKTKRLLGYVGCAVFFLLGITSALFGGAGWGFATMFWMLCALWAIQFLIPKDVLTPTAIEEKARLEKVKLHPPPAPPPLPGSTEEKLNNLVEVFGRLLGGLIFVLLVVGIIVLLFIFAPWWAAVIILLLLLLLFK